MALGTTSPVEWAEMGTAIVAGIESGWVNPVINKEYAMEEVLIKSISSFPLIDYLTKNEELFSSS